MHIWSLPECASRSKRRTPFHYAKRCVAACVLSVACVTVAAKAQTLRVVTYNIAEDLDSSTGTPGTDLTTVLQGIGNVQLASHAQPIDVLALQELYGTPATTLSAICTQLNGIYGAGTYVYDTTADPTTGNFLTGNGPSGLIYNHNTIQLWSAAAVGSASGSGAPRAPMKYTLAPKGYNDHSADFTIYVSHMKSGAEGSGSPTNGERRRIEAQAIRDNAYTLNDTLNGNTSNEVAHIIYAGDYNWGGSSEDAYQTMIATDSGLGHSGIMKAHDTLAEAIIPPPPNQSPYWDTTSAYKGLLTESATFVQYRDDVQLVSGPMLNQPGTQLVSNTLTAFGNGGNIYHQSVASSSNNNALSGLPNRTAVINGLTTATDHLPVVADYSFATAVGAPGDYDHSGVVNAADYKLWRGTFGTTGNNLLADGNHNNVVDAADYVIWRRYSASGSGAGSLASGSDVPEPATWLLMLSGCLAFLGRSRLRG